MQRTVSENGARTPEMIAEQVAKYGKFIGIEKDPFINAYRKYYDVSTFCITDRVVEITLIDGIAVSARYVPAIVAKTLPPLPKNIPDFGNF